MEIFNCSPEFEGRAEKEIRTYKLLEKLGIPFLRVEHDAAATIAECAAVDEAFGTPMCKNLLLCNATKKKFYLLLMPGEKPFDTKELRNQIGSSRLSFAPGEFMESLLDITPGSLSILGLANDIEHKVNLIIDKEVIDAPYICCHPCVNTASLKIKTEDILNIFLNHTGHPPIFVNL